MDLLTEGGRTFRRMAPVQYPDNDREFIIDYLFTTGYRNVRHWRLLPGDGCRDARWDHGYTPLAVWEAQKPGALLVMRGEVEADLAGFDSLKVRVMAAAADKVSIKAVVDGRLVDVASPAPGVDDYGEYTGRISGRRLSAVEVHCRTGQPAPAAHSVMWVMLVKPGEPSPVQKPDPAWPGLLAEDSRGEPKPLIGLLFDAQGMAGLRREFRTPALSARWQETVKQAEAHLNEEPEATANPLIPFRRAQYGRPDVREDGPFGKARTLAMVGLLEKRPDMMRLAARWALTWARCERWVQYGVENLKGVSLSHGRFVQASAAETSALVLDWCGSVLTDEGRDAVARAIHDLGVVDIDGIMHPGSYVWGMNQGLVYERGRFMGATAVRRWYPDEFERRTSDARAMLRQCLAACVAPDGTNFEGPAYWAYTVMQAPVLAHLLAKASGRGFLDELPPQVAASARWAYVNLRTDTDELRMLTHADGHGGVIPGDLAALFAGPLGLAEYVPIARRAFPASLDPLYLDFMREVPQGEVAPAPARPLTVFPDGGQVDVRQDDPHAGMRIYFLSGPGVSHGHDDKNSFALEAFGRALLLDRGTPCYTHPAIALSKLSMAHNTVTPGDTTQTAELGRPAARLLRVEEVGPFVIIESDAAEAWPGLGDKALRRLIHLRPATLIVEDVVAWRQPAFTRQHWHSRGEWQREGDAWVARVDGAEVRVDVLLAEGASLSAAPYSVDGDLKTVHRLCVEMPRAQQARIVTLIRARSDAAAPWESSAEWESPGRDLRLETRAGGRYAVRWDGDAVRLES